MLKCVTPFVYKYISVWLRYGLCEQSVTLYLSNMRWNKDTTLTEIVGDVMQLISDLHKMDLNYLFALLLLFQN